MRKKPDHLKNIDDNYKFHKIVNIFKLIVMIEEFHFILHVANGIHITIQVYLHVFE